MEDLSRNLGKKRGESSENESISVSYMVTYQKNTTRNSNLTSTESFKLIIESMEKEIFEMKQALKVKIEEQELLKSILTQSKSELSNLDNEIERDQSRLDSAHKRLISLERGQNHLNEEMKKIEDETVQMKSNIEEVKIAYRKEVDQLSVDLQNATIKYRNFMQLNNSKEDQKGLMDEQSQLQTKAAQLEEDVKKYETLLKSISAPEAQNSEENVSIRQNIKYLKMCLNKELEEF